MTAPAQPAWVPLAARALHAAQRGDEDVAVALVKRIHDEFGADALPWVMLAWADSLIDYVDPAGLMHDQSIALAFRNPEDGAISTADGVPSSAAWAGQFLVARLRNDRDTFMALVNSVADNSAWGNNVMALLMMVAGNLNRVLAARPREERVSGG